MKPAKSAIKDWMNRLFSETKIGKEWQFNRFYIDGHGTEYVIHYNMLNNEIVRITPHVDAQDYTKINLIVVVYNHNKHSYPNNHIWHIKHCNYKMLVGMINDIDILLHSESPFDRCRFFSWLMCDIMSNELKQNACHFNETYQRDLHILMQNKKYYDAFCQMKEITKQMNKESEETTPQGSVHVHCMVDLSHSIRDFFNRLQIANEKSAEFEKYDEIITDSFSKIMHKYEVMSSIKSICKEKIYR